MIDAATTLFLQSGYPGTSMDEIADAAGVSKRTLYNNWADKEHLFRTVVLEASPVARQLADEITDELAAPDDLHLALTSIAQRQIRAATSHRLVKLRRLLIGEAHRFPDLAAEYYDLAPGTVMAAMAAAFERLARQGSLRVDDPTRAAEHFAFLVLGASLDRALFTVEADDDPPDERLDTVAEDGVRAFLRSYATDGSQPTRPAP